MNNKLCGFDAPSSFKGEGWGEGYAELHCLSNFSFLKAASHPEELVQGAHDLGYRALAITDECSMAGVVRAHVEAKRLGMHLIIGSELRCTDGLTLVALAQSRRGYAALCRLITRGRRAATKGSYQLEVSDVLGSLEECCVIWLPMQPDVQLAKKLRKHFVDRLWLGIELHCQGQDRQHLRRLEQFAAEVQLPLVACGGVRMHVRERQLVHDTLTAIRLNKPLHECGYALQGNGERHLRRLATLQKLYPSACLAQTLVIAGRCRFSLDELRYEYPHELVPEGKTASEHLRQLTYQGAVKHWPDGVPDKVHKQLCTELELIEELQYESYFLTVHDLVQEARRRHILCQGRGSAANSAVCYCLGVTAVNPVEQELLFARFLSRERREPPDIDIDFEHERREEIIQYIYEKYGRHRAGLAATVICYRRRSALRDVGKALGLDSLQLERLVRAFERRGEKTPVSITRWLREAGFDPHSHVIINLLGLVEMLRTFPRHLSQHVGGFVIAAHCLEELVPVENASMPGRTVIEWDKDDLESLGLLKVDVLALGMLTAIRRALDLYNSWHGKQLTLETIPRGDSQVYKMIQQADTIGVFQIESRAQMSMLPRLKPSKFYDLVVQIAIVRPGPIQGDMVHPYLRRRDGLEEVDSPSPEVEEVLRRTYGVPIFQEQVMQLAIVAAGFKPGEADQLRRAMATWKKTGTLERFREQLCNGMLERGYTQEYANRIFRQIEGFGEYGFPESHSASFAVLAYASAWLKYHAPAEFAAALLNSQPMGFYQPAQLVQDARAHGVQVRPVDVLHSDWYSTLELERSQNLLTPESTTDIHDNRVVLRLGLQLVSSFSEQAAQRLVQARQGFAFTDAQDLALRAQLNTREMAALAVADALHALVGNRHQSAWKLAGIDIQLPLFAAASVQEATPMLPIPTEGQNIHADYATLGLTLRRHPMALLRERCLRHKLLNAEQLRATADGRRVRTSGLVLARQSPGTARDTTFITLEDETGQVNLIVWSNVAQHYRQAFLSSTLLEISGKLQRHHSGVMHVVVESMTDRSHWLGGLQIRARNFH